MSRLGAVVIGRNEGERFRRCLESLSGRVAPIVYVDSGSTDGSVEHAQQRGADVVTLDSSIPFTAARARNAGFSRLRELEPDAIYVMFVDGDCEVSSEWLDAARSFLEANDAYAVACGRRRERFPNASIYNYLCDVEWNTPVGDADACGGDAMMRAEAFADVGGFNPSLIAGEEPELCIRMRSGGWKIRRLDEEMTLHDAAMTSFSQWWTRAVRAGHAFAEVSSMHASASSWQRARKSMKSVAWAAVLPVVAVGLAGVTHGASLALLLLYPINVARVAMRLARQGERRPWTVAAFLMLSKFPEAVGWLRFQTGRLTGRRSTIIEYKAS